MEYAEDWQLIFQKKLCKKEGLAQKILQDETQDLQPGIFYQVKQSFRVERQVKGFTDKNKVKKFIHTKSVLQVMLAGIL